MSKSRSFKTLEFVRKVRDQHAAELQGKSPKEILAFFARFEQSPVHSPTLDSTRTLDKVCTD